MDRELHSDILKALKKHIRALKRQLKILGDSGRVKMYFHQRLIKGELPFTIGGGINAGMVDLSLAYYYNTDSFHNETLMISFGFNF